jgi:hypothetical protein
MRKQTLLVLCAALALGVSSCQFTRGLKGSGNLKTEKRSLSSFKAIDTNGAYTVDVTCQKPVSVEIETDDNILPLIKTEVRDGVLYVTSQERYNATKGVTLRVSVPDLAAISSRGAGDIRIADAASNDLKIDSTGAASVKANGKAKSLTISSTGAGDVDTTKLQAEKARVSVSGAASIDVYASEQLDVSVSGVGSVNYSGNPKTVNKNVSGLGSVNQKSE